MTSRFLVTGYDKKRQRMATHIYDDIEQVASVINKCENGTLQLSDSETKVVVKNPKDLEFDVKSEASHIDAKILKTPNFCWSIFAIR